MSLTSTFNQNVDKLDNNLLVLDNALADETITQLQYDEYSLKLSDYSDLNNEYLSRMTQTYGSKAFGNYTTLESSLSNAKATITEVTTAATKYTDAESCPEELNSIVDKLNSINSLDLSLPEFLDINALMDWLDIDIGLSEFFSAGSIFTEFADDLSIMKNKVIQYITDVLSIANSISISNISIPCMDDNLTKIENYLSEDEKATIAELNSAPNKADVIVSKLNAVKLT